MIRGSRGSTGTQSLMDRRHLVSVFTASLLPERMLIAVLVYRQLPTALRKTRHGVLPVALHLRQAQHAEPGVPAQRGRGCRERRGRCGGTDGYVRHRTTRLYLPATLNTRKHRLDRAASSISTMKYRSGRLLQNDRSTTKDDECTINEVSIFSPSPCISRFPTCILPHIPPRILTSPPDSCLDTSHRATPLHTCTCITTHPCYPRHLRYLIAIYCYLIAIYRYLIAIYCSFYCFITRRITVVSRSHRCTTPSPYLPGSVLLRIMYTLSAALL